MRKTVVKKIRMAATKAILEMGAVPQGRGSLERALPTWRKLFRRLKKEYRKGRLAI